MEPWTESDCSGEVPIVVGSDAAAQSDIYSAITLAGVVGTDCVILAGSRDSSMPASQQARFGDAATAGGYVVHGAAAVPDAKLAGRHMTRLGGTTRWETAHLAGQRASSDITAGTDTAAETIQEEGQDGGGSESDEEVPVKDSEQNNSETVFLKINANPVWVAELQMIDDFAKGYGFHETNESGTGYRECRDSEDSQTLEQMIQTFYGDGCNFILLEGCQSLAGSQMQTLQT